jgi:TonB family protein
MRTRFGRASCCGAIAITALVSVFAFASVSTSTAIDATQQQTPPPAQQAPTTAANQDSSKLGQISSPEFDAAVANLATEIQQRNFKAIVVIGAMGPGDQMTGLGPAVGDAFSAALASLSFRFRVVDREDLRAVLKQEFLSEAMLISDTLESWVAGKAGADGFVEIKMWSVKENHVVLTASLYKRDDRGKELVLVRRAEFAMNSEQQDAVSRPLNSDAEIAAKKGPSNLAEMGLSSLPQCIECPHPDYSDEARKAKGQGTAILVVTVTVDGEVRDITVVKAAGFALDRLAVEAIRKWKFKPALDLSGKPVEHRTEVSVQWELF